MIQKSFTENNFRKYFIKNISLWIGLSIVLTIIPRYFISTFNLKTMGINFLVGLILIGISYFVRKKENVKVYGIAIIFCLIIIAINSGITNGGVRAPVSVSLVLVPLIGFLCEGKFGARLGLILTFFSLIFMIVAEYYGFVVPLNNPDRYIYYKSFIYLIAAICSYAAGAAYEDSRRDSELLIMQSEKQLRSIFDASPACIKIIDSNGNLISMNQVGLEMIEADSFNQIKGRCIYDSIVESQRRAYIEFNQRICKNNGSKETIEFEFISLKGSRMWVRSQAASLMQTNGEIVNLSVTENITEIRRAIVLEKNHVQIMTLIAEDTPLNKILDSISLNLEQLHPRLLCSIFLADLEKEKLVFASGPSIPKNYVDEVKFITIGEGNGSCGTAAARREQVIVEDIASSELFKEFKDIAQRNNLASCWSEPIMSGDKLLGTFAIYTLKSHSLPSKEELIAIQSNVKLAAVAIQHSLAEEAIVRQRIQFISSAKMAALGEMAGGISHEINNPLSIIQGKVTMLLDRQENNELDNDRLKVELEKIQKMSVRISKIIKGLRSFSRNSDADKMEMTPITNLVENTLELCQETFKNHNIKLTVNCDTELSMECRESQIIQVLMNLLGNAHDSVEKLSEKWVRLDVMIETNTAVFRVTDSGHGIASEIVAKMMQPFFTTKEIGKGTGLGLSISSGIAQEHQGNLIYDEKSKNTSFILKIPLIQKIEQIVLVS